MRVRGLTLALLITAATAASAQTAGSYELNGFGRYTRFDNALGPENKFGGGGSLGYFFFSNLALEAEGAYTQTTDAFANSIANIPLRGRLSYHIPLGGNASSIRMGAGYVRNLYRKSVNFDDNGFTGIIGLRLGITPTLGLRMDGTADYFRGLGGGRANYVNWGGQTGLSLVFGNSSGNRDKDKDGVLDNADRCPSTPSSKPVDSSGCTPSQLDGDRDRVNDELDRCPNTPSGESVGADGCSTGQTDADHDGIGDTADRCPRTAAGERVNSDGCADSQRDDDGDSVLNNADTCSNTRFGDPVDAAGCSGGQRDGDKDGVADTADQCPNTPAGEAVNPRGCSGDKDTDKDGVADGADLCPNTPAGEIVNLRGCSGEKDTDKDGVPDAADLCPNTVAGEAVNPRGCSGNGDSDRDGVLDGQDQCPNTATGQAINANGCPILFQKGARSVILRGVTFQTGRATLTPEAREVLKDIAEQLVENPQYRVQISGHTDNTGTRAKNLRLSVARARTVETFLEANGVPLGQVTSKGFGPDVPIAPNTTAVDRAKNRRVELNRTN
jgi:outer membrane protein OmpA-like peptidoglycan-associated protein